MKSLPPSKYTYTSDGVVLEYEATDELEWGEVTLASGLL
jgi:hypothetical protein